MSDRLRSRLMVSTQERITIPEEIREKLGIKEGTFLEMEIYGKDKILIRILGFRPEFPLSI